MGFLDIEWIVSNLINLIGAYLWIIVGTVICTVAILAGLAAPIAERLEEVHGALVVLAAHRYRCGRLPEHLDPTARGSTRIPRRPNEFVGNDLDCGLVPYLPCLRCLSLPWIASGNGARSELARPALANCVDPWRGLDRRVRSHRRRSIARGCLARW